MGKSQLSIKTGRSLLKDERMAVREFHAAVYQPDTQALIFFCSSKYNLEILGSELAGRFDCPIIGCTSAGELSTFGYQAGGIVGASLCSEELRVHRHILSPLSGFSSKEAEKLAAQTRSNLSLAKDLGQKEMFGFLLIDGLSILEEETLANLHTCFGNIPSYWRLSRRRPGV